MLLWRWPHSEVLHALAISLRDFIREALDLTPVPADTTVPNQGPLRVSAGGGTAERRITVRAGSGAGRHPSGQLVQ